MYFKDDNGEDTKYSDRQLAAVIISFIITELALAFHIYCSCFLLKLKLTPNSNSNYPLEKSGNPTSSNYIDSIRSRGDINDTEKDLNTNQNDHLSKNNTTIVPFQNNDNKNLFK